MPRNRAETYALGLFRSGSPRPSAANDGQINKTIYSAVLKAKLSWLAQDRQTRRRCDGVKDKKYSRFAQLSTQCGLKLCGQMWTETERGWNFQQAPTP